MNDLVNFQSYLSDDDIPSIRTHVINFLLKPDISNDDRINLVAILTHYFTRSDADIRIHRFIDIFNHFKNNNIDCSNLLIMYASNVESITSKITSILLEASADGEDRHKLLVGINKLFSPGRYSENYIRNTITELLKLSSDERLNSFKQV